MDIMIAIHTATVVWMFWLQWVFDQLNAQLPDDPDPQYPDEVAGAFGAGPL